VTDTVISADPPSLLKLKSEPSCCWLLFLAASLAVQHQLFSVFLTQCRNEREQARSIKAERSQFQCNKQNERDVSRHNQQRSSFGTCLVAHVLTNALYSLVTRFFTYSLLFFRVSVSTTYGAFKSINTLSFWMPCERYCCCPMCSQCRLREVAEWVYLRKVCETHPRSNIDDTFVSLAVGGLPAWKDP
jgi:hypothetical protein